MLARDCPFCQGRGWTMPKGVDPEVLPKGLTCDACRGTGSFDAVKLVRAFTLGQRHPNTTMTMEQLNLAVIDDLRAQRVEEMLDPESVEMQGLRRRIAELERERAPMLQAAAHLANEIRERLHSEVPA